MRLPILRTVLLICVGFFPDASVLFAQFEGLDNPIYIKNVTEQGKLFDLDNILWQPDSFKVYEITSALRKYAIRNNDQVQLFNAEFGEIVYLMLNYNGPSKDQRIISRLQDQITIQHEIENYTQEVTARRYLARYYWENVKNYELAFEQYLVNDQILRSNTTIEAFERSASNFSIARAYFDFKDYEPALEYLNKIPVQPSGTKSSEETYYRATLNIKALAWQGLSQLDSAELCLHTLLDFVYSINNEEWYPITYGYLGHNYFLKKEFAQAEKYLLKGISLAIEQKDIGWTIQQKLWLADVYFSMNQPSKAIPLALWSQENKHKNTSQSTQKIDKNLYTILSKIYISAGNISLANKYVDSALQVTNEINTQFSSLVLSRIQQKQYLTNASKIEKEKNVKVRERNILIGFVFLLLFLSIYIYLLRQRKHLQQQQLKQTMISEQHLELTLASEQLRNFTSLIADKNQMIERVQQQFADGPSGDAIKTLQKANLLTYEDWETFKTLFEKVHSGYLKRLQEKLPTLSPAETRFMTLAKLNYSNKEMAYAMGVSPDSVRLTWHRLRKKLQLSDEMTLKNLVDSI